MLQSASLLKSLMILLLVFGADVQAQAKPLKFSDIKRPTEGPSLAIGGYASGCLSGAVEIPSKGRGYQMIRRKRHRFFGHSETRDWIQQYGQSVADQGFEVLVGDVAQPRGGRMKSSHKSHQNGLDLDIWFERPARFDAEKLADPPSLVDRKTETMAKEGGQLRMNARHIALLKTAAQSPKTARIFVNWAIKRHLCQTLTEDRDWLQKLRPWYGHDAHFHVRLNCPADSPECEPQAALPAGTGCDDDLAWFSGPRKRQRDRDAKAQAERKAEEARLNPSPKPPAPPKPKPEPSPAERHCQTLLQLPDPK